MTTLRCKMMAPETTARRLIFSRCIVLLLLGACRAQEPCGAEVKLLLVPRDARSAVRSLKAAPPTVGRVFLYDTEARDLFSHGAILRVRLGATSDLTVKLRLADADTAPNISSSRVRYKCEADRAGDETAYSYSVQTKLTGAAPETGAEILKHLSHSQLQLLQQARLAIDWSKVKRVAAIQSTDWAITKQPPFDKLVLELWEWPGGSVLELSTKSSLASLQAAYNQLRSLAAAKGLALNRSQQFKTGLVLRKSSE